MAGEPNGFRVRDRCDFAGSSVAGRGRKRHDREHTQRQRRSRGPATGRKPRRREVDSIFSGWSSAGGREQRRHQCDLVDRDRPTSCDHRAWHVWRMADDHAGGIFRGLRKGSRIAACRQRLHDHRHRPGVPIPVSAGSRATEARRRPGRKGQGSGGEARSRQGDRQRRRAEGFHR